MAGRMGRQMSQKTEKNQKDWPANDYIMIARDDGGQNEKQSCN